MLHISTSIWSAFLVQLVVSPRVEIRAKALDAALHPGHEGRGGDQGRSRILGGHEPLEHLQSLLYSLRIQDPASVTMTHSPYI